MNTNNTSSYQPPVWPGRFRMGLGWLCALALVACFFADDAQAQGDIIWDTEVTTDDVTNTSPPDYNFTEDAVDVTISYAFSSPAPGIYTPTYSTYFETLSGTFGNETGYFGMQMDAMIKVNNISRSRQLFFPVFIPCFLHMDGLPSASKRFRTSGAGTFNGRCSGCLDVAHHMMSDIHIT